VITVIFLYLPLSRSTSCGRKEEGNKNKTMFMTPEAINTYIRSRRTYTPDMFTGEPVDKATIGQLLENASWAPTHKMTQPWRFKIFYGQGLEKLGSYLAEYYKAHTPDAQFSQVKYDKNKQKALQSACVIAICMQRSRHIGIPEWEEIAAVACAVENIWLSAAAYNLGGYWSSTEAMINGREFLQLKEDERCLGIFYLGHVQAADISRRREPVAGKTEWITE
jgi:nitroreductase